MWAAACEMARLTAVLLTNLGVQLVALPLVPVVVLVNRLRARRAPGASRCIWKKENVTKVKERRKKNRQRKNKTKGKE